jgi:hypothetical protein
MLELLGVVWVRKYLNQKWSKSRRLREWTESNIKLSS